MSKVMELVRMVIQSSNLRFKNFCWLELNVELFRNFLTIVIAISCHLPICSKKFNVLCHQTAKMYTQYYNWYYMPATLRKIVMHGAKFIENNILPVEMFAEEPFEARNKNYKCYWEQNSRKFCWEAIIQDMISRLIDSSDPCLTPFSSSSRLQKGKRLPLLSVVIELLVLLEIPEKILLMSLVWYLTK